MAVLTLAGKPINWAKPPKPTDLVLWSNRTSGGKQVKGSFRTIAHLDYMNSLAIAKYKRGIVVFQSPYNKGVAASVGTHDLDACKDYYIPGVPWLEQQAFARANGDGAYYRSPAQGFTPHIHGFTLPPREGKVVSDDYKVAGFKVGKYVDGGYSTAGRQYTSSQIDDYYNRRTALKGHRHDPTWFPPNIDATIFDLDAYIARQVAAIKPAKPKPGTKVASFRVATNNLMSLPKNQKVVQTMHATPGASVLLFQEADIYHREVRHLAGYTNVPIPLRRGPDGAVLGEDDRLNAVICYKESEWTYISHQYVKQFDGVDSIAKTRHVCQAILRHKATKTDVAFLSYHAVTAGNDPQRKRMRKEGDDTVRKMRARLQKSGYPVVLGADQNNTAVVYPTANIKVRNVLDHIYGWATSKVRLKLLGFHKVRTNSDHDAVVANIQMEIVK